MLIFVIVVAVIVVLSIVFVIAKRKRTKRFDYAFASDDLGDVTGGVGRVELADPLATPNEATEEALAKDFNYDVTDDLLDPSNPKHRDWVSEHPDDATNVDLDQGGSDETSASS